MRKAQDAHGGRAPLCRAHAQGRSAIWPSANPEYRHPFMVERDRSKRVGFIVITTDRGCAAA